jgi:hypothetical protein
MLYQLKNSFKRFSFISLLIVSSVSLNAGFGDSFAGGLIGGGLGGFVGTKMAQPSSPQVIYAEQPQPVVIQQAPPEYYDYEPRSSRPRYAGRKRRSQPAYAPEYYDEEDAYYADEEPVAPRSSKRQRTNNSTRTQEVKLQELEAANKKLELEKEKLQLEVEKLKLSQHPENVTGTSAKAPTIEQAEHVLAEEKKKALKQAAEKNAKAAPRIAK